MDWQTIINIVAGVIGAIISALGGALYHSIKEDVRAVEKESAELKDKLQRQEVLVASEYAKRVDLEKITASYKDDLNKLSSALLTQLNRIENKLDGKMDKQ